MILFRKRHLKLVEELMAQHARQTKVIEEMVDTFKKMDHVAETLHRRLAAVEQILLDNDIAVRPPEAVRH